MQMLKALAYRCGSLAGAPRLMQRLLVGDGAAILMYHAVTARPVEVPDWCFLEARRFREQLLYLKQHCHVVPLREIAATHGSRGGRPVVALTFDDGFRNNYSVALPILRELGLSATVFLATDFIASDDTPWFCRVHDAVATTALRDFEWEGESYELVSVRARGLVNARLQARLKSYPHHELLLRMGQLLTALGAHPARAITPDSPYRMLNAHEIGEMAGSGLIEFGAHTCSHAILSGLSQAERTREISASLSAVERLTGARCDLFAYPNGRACDYGEADLATLRARHVALAVTTVEGPNESPVSALELRRYGVGADMSLAQFKLQTHHVLWKLRS